MIKVINKEGEEVKSYNLPVSAHVVVKDNAKIKAGDILIKIPRAVGKSGGDITGGLPRVTELFEARNRKSTARYRSARSSAVTVRSSSRQKKVTYAVTWCRCRVRSSFRRTTT